MSCFVFITKYLLELLSVILKIAESELMFAMADLWFTKGAYIFGCY